MGEKWETFSGWGDPGLKRANLQSPSTPPSLVGGMRPPRKTRDGATMTAGIAAGLTAETTAATQPARPRREIRLHGLKAQAGKAGSRCQRSYAEISCHVVPWKR